MKYYFLTDESEKSLAPFFSKRVLETAMASAVIVGLCLVVFWPRKPLSEFFTAGHQPTIFFLIFAATLIVNSYVNLCCGSGDMVRRGSYLMNHGIDNITYEKEISFFRYGLIEFLLHTVLLLLPFFPFLTLAGFSAEISIATFLKAVFVLYTASLLCRLSGFLVYLFWGRSSTLGYFTARALLIVFVFATILFAPAANPLQILYLLNKSPNSMGLSFAIYMAVVLSVILSLILVNNAIVGRHINEVNRSGVQSADVEEY